MIQDNSSFRQRNVYKMIQHKLQSNYQRSNVIEQDIQNKDLKDQANIQSGQLILRQSRSQQLSTTPKTNSKSSNDKMPYIHFNTPQAIIKNKFKDKLFLSQKFSHDQGETNNYKKQLSIASSPIQKPLDLNSSQISNTNSAYYINQNLEQCFQKPQQGRLIYTSQNFVNFIKNKIRKSQPTHQKFSIYSEESSQLLEQSMYLLNMADSRILNLNQPYQVEIEETLQKSQQKNFYSPGAKIEWLIQDILVCIQSYSWNKLVSKKELCMHRCYKRIIMENRPEPVSEGNISKT